MEHITALAWLFVLLAQAVLLIAAGQLYWRVRRRRQPHPDMVRMIHMVRLRQDAVCLSDADGRVVWANETYAGLTGYTLDALRSLLMAEVLRNGAIDGANRNELAQALQTRTELRINVRFRRRSGDVRWMAIELHPMHDLTWGQFIGLMVVQIDIEESRRDRERMHQALRDHENLNSIMDQHAIVSETDLTGRILRFNKRFTHVSGYAQDELLGLNHRLLNSGHHSTEFWRDMWTTISEGRIWRGEICNRAKNGSLYWVDSVIAPLLGPDGLPERYVSVRSDITTLKNHEALLRRTGKIAGVGGWYGYIDSGVLYFSEEARSILQLDVEQMRVGEVMQRLSQQEAETLLANVSSLIHGQTPSFSQVLQLAQPEGSPLWLRLSGEIELHKGAPYRLVGSVQDITPHVLARQRIQAAERLLRSAFEALGEAFAVYDQNERLLLYNEKYGELLGPDGRQRIAVGMPFDTIADMLQEAGVHRSGQTQAQEMRYLMKQSEFRYRVQLSNGRWVKYTGHTTPDGLHVLFRIDITDIQEALQAAEAAARSKSQFLANMSHEIRTPMNAVIGLLQLLRQTTLDTEQDELLGKIDGSARTLLGILNDILDFSKIEAGKMQLDREPFDLDALFAELSPILSGALGDKALELVYDLDPDIPRTLLGDVLRLKQVLINLGGNAIKFTAQGQVLLRVRQLRRDERGTLLEFAVQDTGIGISAEQIGHIFSGFSQAEASTSRRYGGTGLGLAISQRLVSMMVEATGEGNALSVESETGQGSRFSFQLLLSVAAPVGSTAEVIDEPDVATRAWLLAPPSTARTALARMLAGRGWRVDEFDGMAALQWMRAKERAQAGPDVVLLDMEAPAADALLAELQAWFSGRPGAPDILTLSARPMRRPRAVLHKPVTAGMVQTALQRKRAPVQRAPAQVADARRLEGLRLLLVEDNLINQEVALRILNREGARISVTENGQQALDALHLAPDSYDLVLMDVQMPVMDGLQATRTIRRQGAQLKPQAGTQGDGQEQPGHAGWPSLPIIAMTANAMLSDRLACLEAGMNDHIGKPFEQEQLIQIVLRYARGAKGQAAVSARDEGATPAQAAEPSAQAEADPENQPLLDAAGALSRLGGDEVFYAQLLRDFATQGAGLCERMAAGTIASPITAVGDAAHQLKSTARTVGALRLGALAARIEQVARRPRIAAGDASILHDLAASQALLPGVWRQTLQAQADWLEGQGVVADRQQKVPMDWVADWAVTLDALAERLRFNDMEALDWVDALLARHKDMQGRTDAWPELQAPMQRLQDAMEIFDIGRALTEVQALRKVDLRVPNRHDSEKPEGPETHPRKESGRKNEPLSDESD